MGKLRVAAYCRISTNHEEQESSLETQISYYGKLIAGHEDWELVKIYAERASGTQLKKRPEFMQMIKACKQGKIDLILTKSISRFGRNMLDTLRTLYELFNLGVKIYFEKENLNNFDREMRTMMGIYAGFAQEESKNMSDNIKWGIRGRMREGKVCLNCTRFLGYDKDENGKNNTEMNYTDIQSINQSGADLQNFSPGAAPSVENDGLIDGIDRNAVEEAVKKQIDYDCLMSFKDDAVVKMVEEIKDLMVDVLCGERTVISEGKRVSEETAKAAYRKITFEHVQYVLHSLLNYPDKISRIDRFLTVSCSTRFTR